MLKLTSWQDHESFIYISAKAIRVLMRDVGDKTIVDVGRTYWVTETPEQIMAMSEMQKVFNPLVSLPATAARPMGPAEYLNPNTQSFPR